MGKRQEIRERRRKAKRRQRLFLVLVITGIALIFGGLLLAPTLRQSVKPMGEYVIPEFYPHPNENANAMGDPDAPVRIDEYSDFGCGHCANFAQAKINQLIDDYVSTGKVYFVYHSVGTLIGSPMTVLATEAAYCAGDQNRFWDYHNMIFANQYMLFFGDQTYNLNEYLISFARDLGLNVDEFKTCFEGGKYQAKVQEDEANARQAGIDGTPTFIINGDVLRGDQPYEAFKEMIEAKLAEKK